MAVHVPFCGRFRAINFFQIRCLQYLSGIDFSSGAGCVFSFFFFLITGPVWFFAFFLHQSGPGILCLQLHNERLFGIINTKRVRMVWWFSQRSVCGEKEHKCTRIVFQWEKEKSKWVVIDVSGFDAINQGVALEEAACRCYRHKGQYLPLSFSISRQ